VSLESTIERVGADLRRTARRAAFGAVPRLASAALEMEARRLGAASIPHFFAHDIKRIPPALNDGLLERLARGQQALANRFGFFGETEQSESEINWHPPRSEAWRTELHAFDDGLDLALSFHISGDARYARHLRYLMASWVAANPPGRGTAWDSIALARRIRNWALAADLSREVFEADADFVEVFTSSLAQQATFLAWELRTHADRRARLAASRALLVAGRCFARGESLRALARTLLSEALAGGAASFPDQAQADRALDALQSALEELEGMLHPDGTLPLFGGEALPPPEAVAALFSLGAAILSVPRWKSLAGGELALLPFMLVGEAGLQRFQSLPHQPWHAESRLRSASGIYRLGDGGASAMLITGTPPASALDHQDQSSFELTIGGQKTIVDSGIPHAAGCAPEADLAVAVPHNVVRVNGRNVAAARIRAVPVEAPGVEGLWLVGGANWGRGYFLVDGKHWVVADRLEGIRGRRIESLLHFYPAFEIEVRSGGALARSGAASVAVIPLGLEGALPALTLPPPGCYSPAPGIRYPSPVLALRLEAVPAFTLIGYIISSDITSSDSKPLLEWVDDTLRLTLRGKRYLIPGSAGL
jgi:uncharacterized heparinase superfamily protein